MFWPPASYEISKAMMTYVEYIVALPPLSAGYSASRILLAIRAKGNVSGWKVECERQSRDMHSTLPWVLVAASVSKCCRRWTHCPRVLSQDDMLLSQAD